MLLAREAGVTPDALRFGYSAHGKPFLIQAAVAGRETLHFNVAHSGDLALVALARGARVGVDVERIRAGLDFRALAKSVFSADEQADLAALPEDAACEAFFTGWARKEAFVKAVGEGLSYALDRFSVTLSPGAPPRLLLPAGEEPTGWVLHALEVGEGYAAAAVSEGTLRVRCFEAQPAVKLLSAL